MREVSETCEDSIFADDEFPLKFAKKPPPRTLRIFLTFENPPRILVLGVKIVIPHKNNF